MESKDRGFKHNKQIQTTNNQTVEPILYVLDHIPLKTRHSEGEKSGNVSHQNFHRLQIGTEVDGFLGMDPFHGNMSWQLSRLSGF